VWGVPALARNGAETATPLEFVVAVVVMSSVSVKVPSVAVVALNVTGSPLTAFEFTSKTVTDRGFANCVPTVVLWGLPPATLIACGIKVFDMKKRAVDVVVAAEAITL